jgi:acetyl-CoA synthetase
LSASARETTGSAAIVDPSIYARLYESSVRAPERFWVEHGRRLDWIKPYSRARDISYGPGEVRIRWYEDGTLNAAANCIDRHLQKHPDRTAIIWEGDEPRGSGAVSEGP